MAGESKGARSGISIASCLHIVSVMDYLSETIPFEELTISDICKASDVSRASFYRLFEDKYDAVNWFVYEVSMLGHAETGRTMNWYDASIITLSGFHLMRHLLMSACAASGYSSLGETSTRLRIAHLTESLEAYRHVEIDDTLRFQIEFFSHSEIQAVHRWYPVADTVSVEQMAANIETCVPCRLHDLLAMPNDPQKGQRLTVGRMVSLIQARTAAGAE